MKKQDLIKLGFKSQVINETEMFMYNLGNNKTLNMSGVGTPSEVLSISEINNSGSDVVILKCFQDDNELVSLEILKSFILLLQAKHTYDITKLFLN